MGGFENVDEAMIAGARIDDADIASDAAIKPIKVAKRSLFVSVPLANAVLSGTSVAHSAVGVFDLITLPDANAGTVTVTAMAPRGEVSPGDKVKLHIWWLTAATSGSARFVVDIKPAIEGISGLGSAIEKAVLSDARASGSQFIEAIVEFSAAVFSNNQLIGIKITRDGTNSLDDLGADLKIGALYLEMQGRC